MLFKILLCLCLSISLTSANTEKAIFLGPEPVNIPAQSTSLAALHIDTLTPVNYSLRKHLDVIFPTEEFPRGKEAWLILDNLTESQRYEVRVCWLATVSPLTCSHLTPTQHAHPCHSNPQLSTSPLTPSTPSLIPQSSSLRYITTPCPARACHHPLFLNLPTLQNMKLPSSSCASLQLRNTSPPTPRLWLIRSLC